MADRLDLAYVERQVNHLVHQLDQTREELAGAKQQAAAIADKNESLSQNADPTPGPSYPSTPTPYGAASAYYSAGPAPSYAPTAPPSMDPSGTASPSTRPGEDYDQARQHIATATAEVQTVKSKLADLANEIRESRGREETVRDNVAAQGADLRQDGCQERSAYRRGEREIQTVIRRSDDLLKRISDAIQRADRDLSAGSGLASQPGTNGIESVIGNQLAASHGEATGGDVTAHVTDSTTQQTLNRYDGQPSALIESIRQYPVPCLGQSGAPPSEDLTAKIQRGGAAMAQEGIGPNGPQLPDYHRHPRQGGYEPLDIEGRYVVVDHGT